MSPGTRQRSEKWTMPPIRHGRALFRPVLIDRCRHLVERPFLVAAGLEVFEHTGAIALAALLSELELAFEGVDFHLERADALHHAIDVLPRLTREVVAGGAGAPLVGANQGGQEIVRLVAIGDEPRPARGVDHP